MRRVRNTIVLFGLAQTLLVSIVVGSSPRAVAQTQQSQLGNDQGAVSDGAIPQQIQPRQEAATSLPPEVRDTLSRYGSFASDDTYGEIWQPTVTPAGWHPYPPCHWVKAKRWGLFYNDQTEWGRIVHHFGRWIHDDIRGWMWIAGTEFSPAWVVWRSSRSWTGWAPLPPTNDETRIANAMAGADSWLFQETPILLGGCKAEQTAAPTQISSLLVETPFMTRVGFWDDMAAFIVPNWIAGPFVQIDLSFKPWPHWFIVAVANEWNFAWHHTTIANVKTSAFGPRASDGDRRWGRA